MAKFHLCKLKIIVSGKPKPIKIDMPVLAVQVRRIAASVPLGSTIMNGTITITNIVVSVFGSKLVIEEIT